MVLLVRRALVSLNLGQIVVERLTKNVTEEHLREIFGQYGPIDDMDVPLSRQCRLSSQTWQLLIPRAY